MKKLISFSKWHWRYIVVAVIALLIGGSFGPSQCAVHVMNDHILELNDEINNGKDELKVAKAT